MNESADLIHERLKAALESRGDAKEFEVRVTNLGLIDLKQQGVLAMNASDDEARDALRAAVESRLNSFGGPIEVRNR